MHTNPEVAQTILDIADKLQSHNITIFLEKDTAEKLPCRVEFNILKLSDIGSLCDLAIIVGGDGNFLNVARNLSYYSEIPMIGINKGKLGFLTDISPNEIETRLIPVLQGHYNIEERLMVTAEVYGGKDIISKTCAFNEIMIAAGLKSRLFELSVDIDGKYAFSQRSDGIIIATPTGSTAHALSAGGPIMYPDLNALTLVPMFSHSLNSRPIVVNSNSSISIKISSYNKPEPILSFDGHSHTVLNPGNIVEISKSPRQVKVLHPLDYDYFKSLRTKLHWSKMLF